MNTWNRHIHTGTQNVHNVHNAHTDNIGIPKHKKNKNTLRLLSSGTKLFITFALKVIRHKESDTQSFYADFSICPPPSRAAPRRKLLVWSRRAPKVNRHVRTQLTHFSQIPKILRFRCMTSFTSPGLICYLGFLFWHLWMTHPPRARVNTCAHVAPN